MEMTATAYRLLAAQLTLPALAIGAEQLGAAMFAILQGLQAQQQGAVLLPRPPLAPRTAYIA